MSPVILADVAVLSVVVGRTNALEPLDRLLIHVSVGIVISTLVLAL